MHSLALANIFICVLFSSCHSFSVYSSCSGRSSHWNYGDDRAAQVKSWLYSLVTVQGGGSAQSRMFDPEAGVFTEHFAHFNDVMGKADHDEETDRRVVTVGTFIDGIPTGLTWQWRTRRMLDGFLYGEVNMEGKFTGEEIAFIYPDFLTGLRGTFVNGKLQEAYSIEVVAERCKDGMKELKIEVSSEATLIWKREEANATYIGQHPQAMDPHEKKSVYVDQSFIPRSKEGVFALRKFMPGDLISYFGGLKTFEENFLLPGMTEEEAEDAASYYYNLGLNIPAWWGYHEDIVIDTPGTWREEEEYRTTLAHKVNHKFKRNNAVFDTVHHPVLGALGCILAKSEIDVHEEVYVNYEYDLAVAPGWYRQGYQESLEEHN